MPNHRITVTLSCAYCGAAFERGVWHSSQAPKHCSPACVSAARRAAPPKPRSERATVSCAGCGTAITRTVASLADSARRGRKTYCSWSCSSRTNHTGRLKPYSRINIRAAIAARIGRKPWNAKPPVIKSCESCDEPFSRTPSTAARSRFCSTACKHAKRRTVTGPEHWLFTRQPRACEMCGTTVLVIPAKLAEFRFCSRRCVGSYVSNTWPRTSSLETALHAELAARGVSFEIEHAIGPYTVDIALPSERLVIEADGTYWHGTERQQAKDRRKDQYMRNHGWRVLRFTEVAINASPAACVEAIMLMLPRFAPSD